MDNSPPNIDMERSTYFRVEGISYTCRPWINSPGTGHTLYRTGKDEDLKTASGSTFVTVLRYDNEHEQFSAAWLKGKIEQHIQEDDVLQPAFLQTILIAGFPINTLPGLTSDLLTLLEMWSIETIKFVERSEDVSELGGPYLLKSDKHLWQIFRLYEATQRAFLVPVAPKDATTFCSVNDGNHGWFNCSLSIPSQLCSSRTPQQPLAGYRVAVKDAFDLRGLNMSQCNRDYLELYPEAQTTAESLQPILRKGAFILGKTKLSMFLSREEPCEAVDFQTAWNPRGDGYQGPGRKQQWKCSSSSCISVG